MHYELQHQASDKSHAPEAVSAITNKKEAGWATQADYMLQRIGRALESVKKTRIETVSHRTKFGTGQSVF